MTRLPSLSKPREPRQERSRIKASNPNLFIPKSYATIPAFKAEHKQGRLQAEQRFPLSHGPCNCQDVPPSRISTAESVS